MTSMQDAKDSLDSNVRTDKKGPKTLAYLFSRMIDILESLWKAWDKYFLSLRTIFADIFKFF